ncbi:MAG TPA: phosphate ABC transporter substrate-binding protein [Opitutales bacterium]|nr:phosphate ABC transporter substrate-binding protein [Opitutales bacterium]
MFRYAYVSFWLLALLPQGILKAETIVIMGSDTIGAKAALHLAEAYKSRVAEINPDIGFEISAEGSSTGVVSITEGHADIGMISRKPSVREKARARAMGVELKAITVARDGIAVVVHEQNPIESISLAELEAIFTGDVRNWAAIGAAAGPISVYTRNTASGTYDLFREKAMSGRDYGEKGQKVAGNEQIASEIARNRNGIGYIGIAYTGTPGIKVVPVEGMLPKAEEYPLRRTLYYLVDENIRLSPAANDFIGFTLSPQGQHIIEEVDFLPLY